MTAITCDHCGNECETSFDLRVNEYYIAWCGDCVETDGHLLEELPSKWVNRSPHPSVWMSLANVSKVINIPKKGVCAPLPKTKDPSEDDAPVVVDKKPAFKEPCPKHYYGLGICNCPNKQLSFPTY